MKLFKTLFVIALLMVLVFSVVRMINAENNTLGTGAGSTLGIYSHSNTYLGELSGTQDTSGVGNTAVGYAAGYQNRSGAGNVYLGYMAGYTNSTNYQLFIQHYRYPTYGIFGGFNTGYFGINKTPTRAWDVSGSVGADSVITTNLSATTAKATTFSFPNGETIDNSVNGNIRIYGKVVAAGDTHSFTSESVVTHAGEADTSTIQTVGGKINLFGTDGKNWSIGLNTSDVGLFTNASGGYSFDQKVILSNAEEISNAVNGTVQIGAKTIAVGDTHVVSAEALVVHPSEADTSSWVFVGGKANVYGTDGKTFSIAPNTSDAAVFSGATGGYSFDAALTDLLYKPKIMIVTTDTTLTAAMSGSIITNVGAAAGDSIFLPTCASGLEFTFMSSDADTMIISCAAGDSIFDAAETKPSKEGHAINQALTIVGLPTAGSQFNWIVKSKNGTWTGN